MSWTADRTDVTADSTSFTADGWEIVYPLGALRRVISPRMTGFAAVGGASSISLTWSYTDALAEVTATITRIPSFSVPVAVSATQYTDSDVTHGVTYSYSLYVTDARGIDSVPSSASLPFN